MPFKIIRNDITKVKADAIVNTANPHPVYASGTDSAIYHAAGVDQLLAERKKIGEIARGEVVVTDAFALKAKYIIHTVGPIWIDGQGEEFDILHRCYRNSLKKALELGCTSIAFPLISTGVYGFPKDKALQIAVSEFSAFLTENEMQIILVVYDKKSFQLSSQIVGEIDSYIDSKYISAKLAEAYEIYPEPSECLMPEESDIIVRRVIEPRTMRLDDAEECFAPEDEIGGLEEELAGVGMSFHDKLFELISAAGMDNKDVWKNANLDRKHFSKIQCDVKYHPKKKTVMALCIALKLDIDQSRDLMARADWAFSPSSKVDLIVQKAIIDRKYDIYQLNVVLFKYTNEILGV